MPPEYSPEYAELLKSVGETHEQLGGLLSRLNETPSSTPVTPEARKAAAVGVGDGSGSLDALQKRMMDLDDIDQIRQTLRPKSMRELMGVFSRQAARNDTGIPLYEWLAAGGAPLGARWERNAKLSSKGVGAFEPGTQKALDSVGASALIRQDLEPILYEVFFKLFPLVDAFETEPANGLVHAYDRMLSFGDADWIGELDTVTDDRGEYERAFTNVGILATRRGVSLKSQLATLASGSGFNPERLELLAGMRAMSSRLQKTLLHGNWQDPAGTILNERGPYDDDSFDGLRHLTNSPRAINVDPATSPDTTGSIRRALARAILPLVNAGQAGSLVIWGSPEDALTFDEQQETKERIIITNDEGDMTLGMHVTRVRTTAGIVPFYQVAGGYVGEYDPDTNYAAAATVRDLYVLNTDTISRPYLGSPGPTVIEIPMGVTGQLNHLFIIFMMTGFKMAVPTFNNKVRIKVT
jgi:hypothetical protein